MRFVFIAAFLAFLFWLFAVVDCAVQPPIRHRGVSKTAWMLIVLLLSFVGGVLWFTIGRARPRPVNAPDDDPRFLRTIDAGIDHDERIRQLEEEIARLDDEDSAEDPDAQPRTRPS